MLSEVVITSDGLNDALHFAFHPAYAVRRKTPAAAKERRFALDRFFRLLDIEQREPTVAGGASHITDIFLAELDDGTKYGRFTVDFHRIEAFFGQRSLMHARGKFLAHIAALGPADAVEQIKITFKQG
jgi:hypothetical protein